MVEPLVETPPLVHSLPSSCHQLGSFKSGLTQLGVNYLDFHQVKDTTSFRAWSYHQVDNGARIHQQCHLLIQSNGQVGKYYIWPNNHAWRLFPRPLHIALPLMQVKGWVGKRGIGPPWFSLDLAPHSPISPITNFLVLCPPSPYPLFLVQLFISSPTFCQHICVGLCQPVASAKSEILPSSVIQNFPFINEQQRRYSVHLVRTSRWVLVAPRDKNQQLNILMLLPRSFKADNTRWTKKWKYVVFYQHPRIQLG